MNKVLVIVGPTASGKSDLAVYLARRFEGEVISADSRQVYRGLDVGSGKISKKERQGIPHHLIDVTDPRRRFSVSDYQKLAKDSLRHIFANSKLPIIVGGTGFYIDALMSSAEFPDVAPNKELREKLSQKNNDWLFKLIQKKDPARAETIDRHNKLRLIRALEIIEAIGKVPELKAAANVSAVYVGLLPENLDERIRARLKKRMPGMIREARRLISEGLTFERMHELGLEYRYLALLLQGKMTREEMTEKLFLAIRQYAKRQMTWFRRNMHIKWFTLSKTDGFKPEEHKEIEKYLRENL